MIEPASDRLSTEAEPPAEIGANLVAMARKIYGSSEIGYMPQLHVLRQLEMLERELLAFPQHEMPVRHYVIPGAVAREMIAPSDTIIIGAIHKYPQINILSAGHMSMLGANGMEMVGPGFTVVTPPGTKRAAYAHTDCIWTTIVAIDVPPELDSAGIADMLTFKSVDEYLASLPPPAALQLEEERP